MNRYWIIVASSLVLTACNTAPTNKSADPSKGTPQASANSPQMATAANAGTAASGVESVYFDFDQSAIKPQFKAVLGQQAEWMKSHWHDSVTVEGNADERGSAEYNLALGNRRATAVRKALVTLGVPAQRIKDVSFGKEKPKATCHEERCWAENRRVDFVFKES